MNLLIRRYFSFIPEELTENIQDQLSHQKITLKERRKITTVVDIVQSPKIKRKRSMIASPVRVLGEIRLGIRKELDEQVLCCIRVENMMKEESMGINQLHIHNLMHNHRKILDIVTKSCETWNGRILDMNEKKFLVSFRGNNGDNSRKSRVKERACKFSLEVKDGIIDLNRNDLSSTLSFVSFGIGVVSGGEIYGGLIGTSTKKSLVTFGSRKTIARSISQYALKNRNTEVLIDKTTKLGASKSRSEISQIDILYFPKFEIDVEVFSLVRKLKRKGMKSVQWMENLVQSKINEEKKLCKRVFFSLLKSYSPNTVHDDDDDDEDNEIVIDLCVLDKFVNKDQRKDGELERLLNMLEVMDGDYEWKKNMKKIIEKMERDNLSFEEVLDLVKKNKRKNILEKYVPLLKNFNL